MTKTTVLTLLLTSCLTFANPSNAASSTIVGPGASSCGEYVSARRQNSDVLDLYLAWVQGLFSGLNTPKIVSNQPAGIIPEPSTLALMIEHACLQHPTSNVWTASGYVYKSLETKVPGK